MLGKNEEFEARSCSAWSTGQNESSSRTLVSDVWALSSQASAAESLPPALASGAKFCRRFAMCSSSRASFVFRHVLDDLFDLFRMSTCFLQKGRNCVLCLHKKAALCWENCVVKHICPKCIVGSESARNDSGDQRAPLARSNARSSPTVSNTRCCFQPI